MRIVATSILILLVLSQAFNKWLTVTAFSMNREFISNNLCENRAQPVLKCKGKCVLMKKIKQDEEQEKSSSSLKIDLASIVLSSRSFYPELGARSGEQASNFTQYPSNSGKPVDRAGSIFHPPGA